MMDNYGMYVWSAYGITLAVFVINVWLALKDKKKIKKIIKKHQELLDRA
jgi:heme exporter protein CcmD